MALLPFPGTTPPVGGCATPTCAVFSLTNAEEEVPELGAGRRERGIEGGGIAPVLMTVAPVLLLPEFPAFAPAFAASCEGGVHDVGPGEKDMLESGAMIVPLLSGMPMIVASDCGDWIVPFDGGES
eukprot:CAMPEP_0180317186 /NCGR_PEP_ID=MMETSP0988-20121125/33693_1 /TAXON_ID=697907 /ORGANISM="non described non described, Strain CCMP2293" /LENGTH=125 /DNA_ID=CAMNT_0022302405 /DNA_START=108 /DNA_END=486 /DNA_ORIENTATION=+